MADGEESGFLAAPNGEIGDWWVGTAVNMEVSSGKSMLLGKTIGDAAAEFLARWGFGGYSKGKVGGVRDAGGCGDKVGKLMTKQPSDPYIIVVELEMLIMCSDVLIQILWR